MKFSDAKIDSTFGRKTPKEEVDENERSKKRKKENAESMEECTNQERSKTNDA